MKLCKFIFIFCLSIWSGQVSAAFFQNDKIELNTYTQYKEIRPAHPFRVLIKARLLNGWHISWDNPGDAGVPVQFRWTLPDGYKVLRLNQSVPEKFLYEDIISQFGYGRTAYYLFEITPDKDFSKDIRLDISWTACRDYCEPESINFTIEAPTIGPDNIFISDWHKEYETAVLSFPQDLGRTFSAENQSDILTVKLKETFNPIPEPFYFIPYQQGIISAAAPQQIHTTDSGTTITVESEGNKLPTLGGLLISGNTAYKLHYQTQNSLLWLSLLSALLAGIILNFMPCVFPILSLKALSLSKNIYKKSHIVSGLLYSSGVILCFLLMAAFLYIFRQSGEAIGWGFQLQSPYFVAFMLAVFIIIFLILTGLIRLKGEFFSRFDKFSRMNSFFTGFFAVLIASPCTGPFMGAALGYALMQSADIYFPIFFCLGLGYALPFTLIEFFPQIVSKILPRPGKWMNTFKIILSFPILLTCIWLVWVLRAQLFPETDKDTMWQSYTPQKIEQALSSGKPVFIDFTAKWCMTCLFNEKTSLQSAKFKNFVRQYDIALFKADWTNRNAAVTEALQNYGRSGVPLYVFYPKGSTDYKILPQILSPDDIEQLFNGQD